MSQALGLPSEVGQSVVPAPLLAGVRTVVFVLADGLGFDLLSRWMERSPGSAFADCSAAGQLTRVTSVLPSTTAAALNTYSTGYTPQHHGVLGYRLFLREVGVLANMIAFNPASGGREFSTHYLNADNFVTSSTLFQRLAKISIPSTVFIWKTYHHSSLSRMLYRGAEVRPYAASNDAFCMLRQAVEARPPGRSYYHLYWDEMDVLQHRYGPDCDYSDAGLAALSFNMQQYLMSPGMQQSDILYLMSADHGHIKTDDEHAINLRDHPRLMRLLLTPPCGDSRLPYLYPRPDSVDAVRDYFAQQFSHCAVLVESAQALQQGWFGFGKVHDETVSRLGHFVVVPRDNWKFNYPWKPDDKEKDSIGKHGGMSPPEMHVPLLAWRWF